MISSLLKPTLVVNNKKYKVMKQIGEGGFAFVYNVKSTSDGEHYALKKMICQTDEQLDEAKKEIDTMVKVKHQNVLPLLDFAYVLNRKGQKEVLLVLPLYQGTVQTMMDQGPGYPNCAFADGLDVLKIMRQIVEGLSAIHACGLRHADLKPANILLSECYQAVITDLGSVSPAPVTVHSRAEALSVQEAAAMFTTASYRAPELYNTPSECVVGVESDIWSLGCLFYAMFYSRSPFETAAEGLSTLSIMSAQYHVPEGNLWPEEYVQVLARCLTADPLLRAPLAEVQASLHCIPCPPLDLHVVVTPSPAPSTSTSPLSPSLMSVSPPPPAPPASTTTAPGTAPGTAAGTCSGGGRISSPHHPLPLTSAGSAGATTAVAAAAAVHSLQVSTTSTTSSAVTAGQIAFSATTASSEQGSFPPTPTAVSANASAATLTAEELNFAEFPPPPNAYYPQDDALASGKSAGATHLTATARSHCIGGEGEGEGVGAGEREGTGSNDEFGSCGSALSGLVFDDHNFEGSVFNASSVADSYVIAEHEQEQADTMSNLSTGNNSPMTHHLGAGGGNAQQKGTTPRSCASFEGCELTETQLRRAEYVPPLPPPTAVDSTAAPLASCADPGDPGTRSSAGGIGEEDGTVHRSHLTESDAGGSGSSFDGYVVTSADCVVNPAAASPDGANSDDFDFDEEFGEFTTGTGTAESAAVPGGKGVDSFAASSPAGTTGGEGREYGGGGGKDAPGGEGSSKAPLSSAFEALNNGSPHHLPLQQQQQQASLESLPVLDLWSLIVEQAQPASTGGGKVVKEGPVYMMRQGGFPKRWAKKQVYLVLTPLGVILRKDAAPDARIHALLALHRPAHLTPTDTLSIGLNGLLVQGSCPLPAPAGSSHGSSSGAAHSPTPGGGGGASEWVRVQYMQHTPPDTTAAAGGGEPAASALWKVHFEPVRFEISFDSKDTMNDWIDAIMECREALLP